MDGDDEDFKEVYSCGLEQQELLNLLTLKSTKVKDLLSRGSCTEALIKSLESPIPIASDSSSLKELSSSIVLETLSSFKSSEISTALAALNSSQVDLLFKFVYKGFESSVNSSTLLNWHEKLVEIAGVGGIVRVLTDMKTV